MEDYFEYFCVLKRTDMKKRGLIGLLLVALIAVTSGLTAFADTPQVDVKVVLVSVSGDSTFLMPGVDLSSTKLGAPLKAKFISTLTYDDGKEYVLHPHWTIDRWDSDENDYMLFLTRWESVTDYEFTDNGKFRVSYEWSYNEKGANETTPGEEKSSMFFTVDESEIRLYNAFSPNGDGINDVYKIYARSIVSMKIAIFNRWGQTIKTISGKIDEILPSGAEPEADGGYLFEIWDGRFNGDIVNDGVYYINVQATGAGGSTFEKKADINVLKGLGD